MNAPDTNVMRAGTAVLVVAGSVALLIGGALLLAPEWFHSSSDIDLGGDVNLLNEVRAPGAALAAMGALMLAGAADVRLRYSALLAAAVLYLSYGWGRLTAWALDGTPHTTLLGAMAVELVIGASAASVLVSARRRERLASIAGDFAEQRYVAVTTFRRNGQPVSTPVWSVPVDGAAFGFYTSSTTGKAKRLGHTSRVIIQPCDARGRPREGTEPVEGTAWLVTGDALTDIRARARSKYGLATTLVRWLDQVTYRLRGKPYHYGDLGVVISIGSSAPGGDRAAGQSDPAIAGDLPASPVRRDSVLD